MTEDVLDLRDHRERRIMQRVERIGERVDVHRLDDEDDHTFEMRVLPTAAADFKAWARERAEEARHAAMRANPLRLTAEYRWMHRRPLPYVHSLRTARFDDRWWLTMLDGEPRTPILDSTIAWWPHRIESRRGDRYLVLEPRDGWQGVEWEDLERAYDGYISLAQQRGDSEDA